jgi:hypothetical protein
MVFFVFEVVWREVAREGPPVGPCPSRSSRPLVIEKSAAAMVGSAQSFGYLAWFKKRATVGVDS